MNPCDPWPYVLCPLCKGAGGTKDFWGEWDECWACAEEGAMLEVDAWWLMEMEELRWSRIEQETKQMLRDMDLV